MTDITKHKWSDNDLSIICANKQGLTIYINGIKSAAAIINKSDVLVMCKHFDIQIESTREE